MIEITLNHPPRILHPNSRPHHMALARNKKKYRRDCFFVAKTVPAPVFQDGPIEITLVWHPKTKNAIDEDGAIASMKAGLDGVAESWGVDDSRFRLRFELAAPVKNGSVILRATQKSQA